MTGIIKEERIGGQRLILGDCLAVMQELGRFDACVTDPPYGLGNKFQGGTWGSAQKYKQMPKWDVEARQEWVDRILDLGVPSVIWGGHYFKVPPSRCWRSWCKPDFPTMADMELAWTNLDKPAKRFPTSRTPDGGKQHPTQKPVALMEWCLGFLPNARTILDPFLGSGTTLVACQRLGRMGTGIEIDPVYFEIACRRVEEATRQPDLFIAPAEVPTQGTLL